MSFSKWVAKREGDKTVTLYRAFDDGSAAVEHLKKDTIQDMIDRDDVVYAALLFIDEGIPTYWRIKGDELDTVRGRAATEAAQEYKDELAGPP